MEKESKFIWVKVYMKVILKMDAVMDLVEALQVRVKYIKVCSTMIKWKEKEFTYGLMEEFLKEFGWLVKSKDKENTSGQMVKFMKEISKMTIVME